MIITKLESNGGGKFPGADYNENKVSQGVAELIDCGNIDEGFISRLQALHGLGIDCGREVEQYLQDRSETCGGSQSLRWQLHFVISVEKHGNTKDELAAIAHGVMREFGAAMQPYFIYFHRDTDNNHVHVLTTRVKPNGNILPDHQDYARLNAALNRVMSEGQRDDLRRMLAYNFTTEGQFMNIARGFHYKVGESEDDSEALTLYHGGAAAMTIERQQLAAVIERHKTNEDERQKREAEARRLKALFIKYRELSLEQKLQSLSSDDNEKKEHAKSKKDMVKKSRIKISSDVKKLKNADGSPLSEEEQYQMAWFLGQLHAKFGVAVHFQKDKGGAVRGYSAVDYNSKIALNGSDIMRLADIVSLKEKAEKQGKNTGKAKARIYQKDATLDIYRPLFNVSVEPSGQRGRLHVTLGDGKELVRMLSEKQYEWYCSAAEDDGIIRHANADETPNPYLLTPNSNHKAPNSRQEDIVIRLAVFFFPKEIYEDCRQRLAKDFFSQLLETQGDIFPPGKITQRKMADGNHELSVRSDSFRLSYKLTTDEWNRMYRAKANPVELDRLKAQFFKEKFLADKVAEMSANNSFASTKLKRDCSLTEASPADITAFADRHRQQMQLLAAALSVSPANSSNREFEISSLTPSLDDPDAALRLRRGMSM